MSALVPWLIFVHVLSAIVAFGPTFAFGVYGAQAGREPKHANFMARANHHVSDRVVLPVALSMPVSGLLIVLAAGINLLGTHWLLLAIILYVVAIGYTLLVQRPATMRLVELTRPGRRLCPRRPAPSGGRDAGQDPAWGHAAGHPCRRHCRVDGGQADVLNPAPDGAVPSPPTTLSVAEHLMPTVASSVAQLIDLLAGAAHLDGDHVVVDDEAVLRDRGIRDLAWTSAFSEDAAAVEVARWLVWEASQELGARSASIQDLYMARGRGEVAGFTVPAINIRAQTFDTARTIFETAAAADVGAVIFELARSEQTYTYQRPAEYVTSVLAGAIAADWQAPVFIQGDHYQFNAAKYARRIRRR